MDIIAAFRRSWSYHTSDVTGPVEALLSKRVTALDILIRKNTRCGMPTASNTICTATFLRFHAHRTCLFYTAFPTHWQEYLAARSASPGSKSNREETISLTATVPTVSHLYVGQHNQCLSRFVRNETFDLLCKRPVAWEYDTGLSATSSPDVPRL